MQKGATFTLEVTGLHFQFVTLLLEEKLASVCRQIGVFHANYGRPWKPARNQSNHLSTTFTWKLPATACQLVSWQVSTVDDLIHLCPANFYYSSFLFITFHFIKLSLTQEWFAVISPKEKFQKRLHSRSVFWWHIRGSGESRTWGWDQF